MLSIIYGDTETEIEDKREQDSHLSESVRENVHTLNLSEPQSVENKREERAIVIIDKIMSGFLPSRSISTRETTVDVVMTMHITRDNLMAISSGKSFSNIVVLPKVRRYKKPEVGGNVDSASLLCELEHEDR